MNLFKDTAGDLQPIGAAQSRQKADTYREYETSDPYKHGCDDCTWTRAPGVWYCYECEKWYRTWKEVPSFDVRQDSSGEGTIG